MAHDVFICHSSVDKVVAEMVRATLENREKKIICWIAPRNITPGVKYAAALVDAINNCKVFLLILSAASNESPQVEMEVDRAASKNLPILCFRIDEVVLSKTLEYYLSNRQWLDAITPPMERHLQRLADAVQGELDMQETKKPLVVNPQQQENSEVPKKPGFRWTRSWVPLALAFSIFVLVITGLFLANSGIFNKLSWSSTSTFTTAPTTMPVTGNITSPMNTSIPFFNIYTDSGAGDNHFFPTGIMGDVDDIEEINQSSTDAPYSGLTDIKIVYNARGKGNHFCPFGIKSESICQWVGLYWLNPADNFGSIKAAGLNLTGFQKLSFWARSDAGSSGVVVKFLVGGAGCQIPIPPPYPDSLCPPRNSGWQRLTDQWQHFEISLKDADLTYVIGGFAWVIDWGSNGISLDNPKRIVLYLDEIRFER